MSIPGPAATVTAPPAPGSLGADVPADQLLAYLDALGAWRDRRRAELDELDEAALRSPDRAALTNDILLSMTLWKAVADRHDLLVAAWDSGRMLPQDRMRLTTLVWGRLDQEAGESSALAVSLPEACRLSDSLAASLWRALGLDGQTAGMEHRVRELRASVERIRDLVAQIPAHRAGSAQEVLVGLDRRLVDVTERLRRGADVGGLVGPLELAVATTERDLIVAASERTRTRDRLSGIGATVADLTAKGEAVRALAAKTGATIRPAPVLAVPDVTALGEPPTEPAELDAYATRLERVGRALEVARSTYAGALERRTDLLEELVRAEARIADLPAEYRADAEALARRAHEVEDSPTDTVHLGALVAALTAYLGTTR
ncbi:hypothetical protein [Mobilicoccus pelagius]|uniref:Uncharacterized protein n=1 Tax=Mobilicoccus pelagius NBRC 104925 TaxID=1089455 RepID=H5UVV9_9MICO|nr:hypothetical protein [Mobilicoccus pelagius]GAB49867.1 hypothetical protein MOPEL_135_01050 [Mobilicoccus pelagius NBRC 104925]